MAKFHKDYSSMDGFDTMAQAIYELVLNVPQNFCSEYHSRY